MTATTEHNELVENPFRLGDWLVEPRLNRLTRGNESIQIEHKMMDVLVCLAERPGDLVPRQHIIDTVWAIEFISEGTLTRIVAELRRALGDDAREPRFIETIRGKGYRLLVPVEVAERTSATIAQFPARAAEDDQNPYPGLAAFTEEDAEFFYGREAEVNDLWRKITSRRLLAVIGPSGVGKTSFLRAGLLPATPEGWGTLICQPGEVPFAALARALAPEFGGDSEAISKLVDISNQTAAMAGVSRWRDRHDQALLIVDQFEELFTLNPPEVQAEFAALIGRLARDVDVHVVLSMRDDFLYRCHKHEALTPVFSGLVPVKVPAHDDLHRALVQPASRFGYTFEDEGLVDEMLDAVAGERGALPLLAFAVERMWVHRDRERQLLTRRAYADIGGVAGALAHHAETTLERIGAARLPVVRELFRNLVTADATRAVREWNEVLSVFDRGDVSRAGITPAPTTGIAVAESVLRALIDARLLTSYEVREEDEAPTRRVEIIHESLLANWPRLVRWQTQDADSARLRDELRQAARTWEEHDRSDDFLWTGSAYREFSVWLVHYPGGLTEIEEAFAEAMTRHAERRSRRRRLAATAAFAVLLAVLMIVGGLWRRAVAEARRAEASKLIALAQVQLDTDPTEALAYATSSLELADTREARLSALKALWSGPPVVAIDLQLASDGMFVAPTFSPDGRWLAVAGIVTDKVLVYGENGEGPIVLGGHAVSADNPIRCSWSRDHFLVTGHQSEGRIRVWAMPGGMALNTIEFSEPTWWQVGDEHLLAEVGQRNEPGEPSPLKLVRWRLPDGDAEDLGTVDFHAVGAATSLFDPRGTAWIYSKGNGVYSRPLPVIDGVPDVLLGRHSSDVVDLWNWKRSGGFFSRDRGGEIILWILVDGTWTPDRPIRRRETATTPLVPDPSGRWGRVGRVGASPPVPLWDFAAPPGASPVQLRREKEGFFSTAFHPRGSWLVAAAYPGRSEATFWPLSAPLPIAVDGWTACGFTQNGKYLLTHDWQPNHPDSRVRLLPVPGNTEDSIVDVMLPPRFGNIEHGYSADHEGRRVIATAYGNTTFLLSADGDEPRNLFGFPASDIMTNGGFSPSGRLVAAATMVGEGEATLRVWDLETDQVRVFEQPVDPEAWEGYAALALAFVDETTLYTAGANGLLRWDLDTGTWERLATAPKGGALGMRMTADRRAVLIFAWKSGWVRIPGPVELRDLSTGTIREIEIPGTGGVVMSPEGKVWATWESDGSVLVGRMDGGEPHLLNGHDSMGLFFLFISPDLQWIATSGLADRTLRLWPMPDLSKPPLHTLPRSELIAKLKTLTNLRAVRDEESSTGWKIEVGPFPGWETMPTW